MKDLSDLLCDYVTEARIPDDTFVRAASLLKQIQHALSGQEWDSDTCNAIAGMMTAEGFLIDDLPTVPAGATHRDPNGNYWAIQEDETNAGEFWTEDGWQVAVFSDSWFNKMEEL